MVEDADIVDKPTRKSLVGSSIDVSDIPEAAADDSSVYTDLSIQVRPDSSVL